MHSEKTTLIRGGTVVTADMQTRADVLIAGERIVAIGRLDAVPHDVAIDATDRLVLPGGVDPHVHFQTPSAGVVTADSFTSGTAAAAFGGTTTALHFCVQEEGERFGATLRRWQGLLAASPPL